MNKTITKKKLSTYVLLVFIAIIVFWLGGYYAFVNSTSWTEIESAIKNNNVIVNAVGKVQKVDSSPLGFYYSPSGNWAETKLNVSITGDVTTADFQIEASRNNSPWKIGRVIKE